MRLIINIILILIILALAYLLYTNIQEPILFKGEKEKREQAVVDRLQDIRTSQELYRAITGEFADNFDTLKYVLNTGSIPVIKVLGDPDDEDSKDQVIYDTLYFKAKDSLDMLGISLDSLHFVPYSKGEVFDIDADTLTYQKTLVQVVEVGTIRNKYMGRFADSRFRRYDDSYDPNSRIKFGDMSAPNLSGNWE